MSYIKELLNEMYQLLESQKLQGNYKGVIEYLYDIYKNLLKDDAIVLDYHLSKKQHHISLKLDKRGPFINLSVSNQSLNILFMDNSEQMYFFEDTNFSHNSNELIYSFLNGEYLSITYLNSKRRLIRSEIIWDNDKLKPFNVSNYKNRVKEFDSKELRSVHAIETQSDPIIRLTKI